ncbi:Chalcone isomerase-like [Variovorax sp. HW608]|uniref:chalcone isomerase family protein n=1 Tax=Variovorax sp. HW608 TaxID=1034889 RepID=UPI00082006C3|nr:chalcone isomerase family protein [Variovorax sp. HW608]SCK61353.1 Chalcone isomerase-like [Variovorax sp. HW608]
MSKSALRRAALLATFALASLAASAVPIDVAGVKLDDAVDVHGARLQLNGAGVRYKAVFKVYTAGLYLGKKAGTPEEVLAAPGAKRVTITMLRDIDANELGKLFTRGVEDNSPKNEMSQLIPGLLRMSGIFSDQKQLKTGDTFTIDWVPGSGTIISVKGAAQGEPIKEQAFFNALVRIWLGPSPADWKLKDALLGKG